MHQPSIDPRHFSEFVTDARIPSSALPKLQGQRPRVWPDAQGVGIGAWQLTGPVALDHFTRDWGIKHGQHVVGRSQLPAVLVQQQRHIAMMAVGVGDQGAKGVEQAQGLDVGSAPKLVQ